MLLMRKHPHDQLLILPRLHLPDLRTARNVPVDGLRDRILSDLIASGHTSCWDRDERP